MHLAPYPTATMPNILDANGNFVAAAPLVPPISSYPEHTVSHAAVSIAHNVDGLEAKSRVLVAYTSRTIPKVTGGDQKPSDSQAAVIPSIDLYGIVAFPDVTPQALPNGHNMPQVNNAGLPLLQTNLSDPGTQSGLFPSDLGAAINNTPVTGQRLFQNSYNDDVNMSALDELFSFDTGSMDQNSLGLSNDIFGLESAPWGASGMAATEPSASASAIMSNTISNTNDVEQTGKTEHDSPEKSAHGSATGSSPRKNLTGATTEEADMLNDTRLDSQIDDSAIRICEVEVSWQHFGQSAHLLSMSIVLRYRDYSAVIPNRMLLQSAFAPAITA
ncbi:hypothetical protein EMMF5_005072 [Cystobasidiomycetes sp. EMM_F5]